jgi:hypothetical protein
LEQTCAAFSVERAELARQVDTLTGECEAILIAQKNSDKFIGKV